MSKQFQAGDIVLCIAVSACGFPGEVGEVYEVSKTEDGLSGIYLVGHDCGSCTAARFELYRPVFKAGDRVEFREKYGTHAEIGSLGTVVDVYGGHVSTLVEVELDSGLRTSCFPMRLIASTQPASSKNPAFNVGDRVTLEERYNGVNRGTVGTVIEAKASTYPENLGLVTVETDSGDALECFGKRLKASDVPAPEPAPAHDFKVGDRLVFTEDYGFFDAGDSGVVEQVNGNDLNLRFDSGIISGNVPASVLGVAQAREFRILTQYGLGVVPYASEEEAVSGHATQGYQTEEFEVVEIIPTGNRYRIEAQPNVAVRIQEAA